MTDPARLLTHMTAAFVAASRSRLPRDQAMTPAWSASSVTGRQSRLAPFAVLTELVAAAILLATVWTLPWFHAVPNPDIYYPSGPTDWSWDQWHSGFVDRAVLLTLIAPYVCLMAALLRVRFHRTWIVVFALFAFALAAIGALDTFSEPAHIIPNPGGVVTPALGSWLFAAAAVAGFVAAAAELAAGAVAARRGQHR
jgi:hypothetical protein